MSSLAIQCPRGTSERAESLLRFGRSSTPATEANRLLVAVGLVFDFSLRRREVSELL